MALTQTCDPSNLLDASGVSGGRTPLWIRLTLWTLPTFAAVGGGFLSLSAGPVELYPFKVIVPVGFLLAVLTVSSDRRISGEVWILLGLMVWAALGTTWAADPGGAVKSASVFLFAALLFALLDWWSQRWPSVTVGGVVSGWRLALVATGLVGAWELATGSHLPTDFIEAGKSGSEGVILSVFQNPNDYGAFLAISIPIALYPAGRFRWLSVPLASVSAVFLVLSGSRFAMIGLLLALVVAAVRLRHRWWTPPATWITVLAGVGGFILLSTLGVTLVEKFLALTETGAFGETSAGSRLGLIGNGLWATLRSGGLGLGGGGFEQMMLSGDGVVHTRAGEVNPHNMWVEVLSELGIVGFAAFVCLLGMIWGRVHRSGVGDAPETLLWAALASYAVAVCTSSSYLDSPVGWMFLATVCVITATAARDRPCRSGSPLSGDPAMLHVRGLSGSERSSR